MGSQQFSNAAAAAAAAASCEVSGQNPFSASPKTPLRSGQRLGGQKAAAGGPASAPAVFTPGGHIPLGFARSFCILYTNEIF